MKPKFPFIAVVEIASGKILFSGPIWQGKAATTGEPGTTWGYGYSVLEAKFNGLESAKNLKEESCTFCMTTENF